MLRLLELPQPFASACALGLCRFAFLPAPPDRRYREKVRRVALFATRAPDSLSAFGGAVAEGLRPFGLLVVQDLPRGLIVGRADLLVRWRHGDCGLQVAYPHLKRPEELSAAEAELTAAARRRGWLAALELLDVIPCRPPLPVSEIERLEGPRPAGSPQRHRDAEEGGT